jgi:hypothetical protein
VPGVPALTADGATNATNPTNNHFTRRILTFRFRPR